MPEAGDRGSGDRGSILRTAAHDLGNLAYRLTFLRASLGDVIKDSASREEATALLDDTTAALQRIAATLREADRHA